MSGLVSETGVVPTPRNRGGINRLKLVNRYGLLQSGKRQPTKPNDSMERVQRLNELVEAVEE